MTSAPLLAAAAASLTLTVPATLTALAGDSRRIRGVIVPWDVPGRTSLGTVRIRRGTLNIPADPRRVRLLYGHDREAPIGAAISLEDTAEGLVGEFVIARTPLGDRYLAELDPTAPIRDGLSVEVDDPQIRDGWLTGGQMVAVAGVSLPAYAESRAVLAAEDTPAAPTLTAEGAPQTPAAPVVGPAAAAGPGPQDAPQGALQASDAPARSLTSAGPSPARTRPISAVRMMAERLAGARMTGTVAPVLAAALADITPSGNGAGNGEAGLMVQALGELWGGVEYQPVYRPLVTSGALTGTTVTGFRWNPAPAVADYAGNKADVPSNAARLERVELAPTRIAGAHDIDRIYRDLGSPDVLASYWRLMTESVARELDSRALAGILAAAGTLLTTPTTVMSAIVKGTIAVSAVATPSYALVASDLAESMAETPAAEAPIGVPFQLPPIYLGAALAAGTVIVGAKQGVRQLTFEPPVRVEAVNIPNGGIDAGLFSYSAELTETAAAVVGYTVTPGLPLASSRGK